MEKYKIENNQLKCRHGLWIADEPLQGFIFEFRICKLM